MTRSPQVVLNGLTDTQKLKVYEWMDSFRLCLDELCLWRNKRDLFQKSQCNTIKCTNAVEIICRDIYELKEFCLKICNVAKKYPISIITERLQNVFVEEDIARWILIHNHLIKPFRFLEEIPQQTLKYEMFIASVEGSDTPNRTSNESVPQDKMVTDCDPNLNNSVLGPDESLVLADEHPDGPVNHTAIPDLSTQQEPAKRIIKVEKADEPERLEVPIIKTLNAAHVPESQPTAAAAASLQSSVAGYEKVLMELRLPDRTVICPHQTPSESPTEQLPKSKRKKERSKQDSAQKNPGKRVRREKSNGGENSNTGSVPRIIQEVSVGQSSTSSSSSSIPNKRPIPPCSQLSSSQTNGSLESPVGSAKIIESSPGSTKSVDPLIAQYLQYFPVTLGEFNDWLEGKKIDLGKLLLAEQIRTADNFLTFAGIVVKMALKNPTQIESLFDTYKVDLATLERWKEKSAQLFIDKTIVKYNLMGDEVFEQFVPEITSFPAHRIVELPSMSEAEAVDLVRKVLEFYQYPTRSLKTLPIKCNRMCPPYKRLTRIQQFLFDIRTLIDERLKSPNEDRRPTKKFRAFDNFNLIMDRMYDVKLSEVVALVSTDNSSLRSKPVKLPKFFDKTYYGCVPLATLELRDTVLNDPSDMISRDEIAKVFARYL